MFESIDQLELGIKTANLLKNINVYYVASLVEFEEAKLVQLAGLSNEVLKDIKDALEKRGLRLGMQEFLKRMRDSDRETKGYVPFFDDKQEHNQEFIDKKVDIDRLDIKKDALGQKESASAQTKLSAGRKPETMSPKDEKLKLPKDEKLKPRRPPRDRKGYVQPNRADRVPLNIFAKEELRDSLNLIARRLNVQMPEFAENVLAGAVKYLELHPEELQRLAMIGDTANTLQRAVTAGIKDHAVKQEQVLKRAVAALKAIKEPTLG